MFDIKWIRDHGALFDAGLAARGLAPMAAEALRLDDARRAHVTELQKAQERRNHASKQIGAAKAKGDESTAQSLIEEVSRLKLFIQNGEEEDRRLSAELDAFLSAIPNVPLADVPQGADASANTLYRQWGELPDFSFTPKRHFELGEALNLMDFQSAAQMSGSRFVVLHGALARLERALAGFMLDLHTQHHGYTEINPPALVRADALFGTGQLPKFKQDLFTTTDDFWLIPTAEVPLTNLARTVVRNENDLPRRFTAWTPCFRSEAGSAGRDTRGMLRQHQFSKVELVSITTAECGEEELERMLACAEEVLKQLQLAYQVVVLSTGDMGFSARKTYDIEVWLPGEKAYREISSCSLCGDFQARRMGARYRREDGEMGFVHSLNGSGLAVGRTLIAVMENYQTADGTIVVPEVLRPAMGGLDVIAGVGGPV